MALANELIDKRIVERSIRRGKVERGEYEAALEALPDVSGNIVKDDPAPAETEAAASPATPEPTGGF